MLSEERVETTLVAPDKASALEAVAALLARGAPELGAAAIARVLRDREALATTGVGDEVAIPHGKHPGLKGLVAALALAPSGVDFDSVDGRPVRIFVGILAPEKSAGDHVRALARVARLLRNERTRARILEAPTASTLLQVIRDEESVLG
ncbi:MAG: PTS sugar transporter subunit IIA [Deltaproteobacteria bacterium]|nr:PTS sugar transporter subunit IIA [Deltaproteobacteria bacterium]